MITDGERCAARATRTGSRRTRGVGLGRARCRARPDRSNPVPRVVGPIRRGGPVETRDVEFLRSLTDRRIKITVPGPFTMTSRRRTTTTRTTGAWRSRTQRPSTRSWGPGAAGADLVQIDEPYLQARPEAAREYAVEATDRALDRIAGETVLHTCFGYAHIVHERLLGTPFLHDFAECQGHSHLARGRRSLTSTPSCCGRCRARRSSSACSIWARPGRDARAGRGAPPPSAEVVSPERLVAAPDWWMKYLPRERAFASSRRWSPARFSFRPSFVSLSAPLRDFDHEGQQEAGMAGEETGAEVAEGTPQREARGRQAEALARRLSAFRNEV